MRVLIFQHNSEDKPGTFADWAQARGHSLHVHPWYETVNPPAPESFDWLMMFGGPMNIDQENEFPWLRPEKVALRAWLASDKPVLGICLGGQLLAQALGAKVSRNAEREVGFLEVARTGEEHPALARWPARILVYQYHEDTFSLPPGATRLLESPACANQAFAMGSRRLGTQFHPESTAVWIQGNAASVTIGDGERWVQNPGETNSLIPRLLPPLTTAFHQMLDDFVAGWE